MTARLRRFTMGCLLVGLLASPLVGVTLHVAPDGQDDGAGDEQHPLATLAGAQRRVRQSPALRREPIDVVVHAGVYYLPAPLVFRPEDSGAAGAAITYRAAPGAQVSLSGGRRLNLTWRPFRAGIMVADVPSDVVTDQLFVDGQKMRLARYPNYDPTVAILGGYAADAFDSVRTKSWAAPVGAYIHALDENLWGDYHYVVTGRAPDGTLTYEGGWQTNRPVAMHPVYRYVENVFEELDAPGEWFLDRRRHQIYLCPPSEIDLTRAVVEIVNLPQLVEFRGELGYPVQWIALEGLTFSHAARTFMETKEPLLRSDWKIFRGGALFFTGTEDCAVSGCYVDQVGGNGIFASGYNRRLRIRECRINGSGASGVAFVGDPATVRNPLFSYQEHQSFRNLDLKPGPQRDDYPADCRVEDCIISQTGQEEKQSAGVQIAMARRISVIHCSIYGMPRAGIDISDGNWGGHLIDGCDVFDTVRETGDHGSFNAWGRERYWRLTDAPADRLAELARLDAVEPTVIRRSRWRCDNGWDIDLDDGASNYEIYDNLLLSGGLKLREGFFRNVHNNVIINNSFHPHVWFPASGDRFTRNIVMGRYRPALMRIERWGEEIDHNFFAAREEDRTAFSEHGCDAHSLAGDALFMAPAAGDFRVRDTSPALRVGFRNFPMDDFGVRPAALRSLARGPQIPALRPAEAVNAGPTFLWLGATVRALAPGEFSVVGLPESSGGVLVVAVPPYERAARVGLRTGDFIVAVGAQPVKSVADFSRKLMRVPAGQPIGLKIQRDQAELSLNLPPPVPIPEKVR